MTATEFKLASGDSIPSIGLGLWKIDKDATAAAVHSAIRVGYRHIDAACDYGNEPGAGDGLQAAISGGDVSRDQLWDGMPTDRVVWNKAAQAFNFCCMSLATVSDWRTRMIPVETRMFSTAFRLREGTMAISI